MPSYKVAPPNADLLRSKKRKRQRARAKNSRANRGAGIAQVVASVTEKDNDEHALESLLFGDDIDSGEWLRSLNERHKDTDESTREQVIRRNNFDENSDSETEPGSRPLFFIESAPTEAATESETDNETDEEGRSLKLQALEPVVPASVWEDDEDEDGSTPSEVVRGVDISAVSRLRKLREYESETVVSIQDYESRLRKQFESLNPRPNWAQRRENESEIGDVLQLLQSSERLSGNSRKVISADRIPMARLKDANQSAYSQSVVHSLKFHPRAPVLMTAGLDRTVRLFQIDGKVNPKIQSITLKDLQIYSANFTPDGREILMTGKRRFFYTFDLESGTVNKVPGVRGHDENSFEKSYLSPCGNYIILPGRDGVLLMLNRTTKQWIADLKMNVPVVRSVDFSSDGRYCYSMGADGVVWQWDLYTRSLVHKFREDGAVNTKVFSISGDSKYFAIGSKSGIVNIYSGADCHSSERPKPLKSIPNLTTSIHQLRFHPDSQILAISSRARKDSLRMLNLPSMRVYPNWPTERTPLSYINSLDFSPSGGYMAIGNDKGKALLYRLGDYA
ncbi:WD40-repeat-containing domain protein [Cladochytrium replicatum]|nr:WD40-repeat-containing domain protein [Cladochytrium replicatum]